MVYDAIVIPGGGVREGGELPSWVKARLRRAIELDSGGYFVTLSAGTTYRPPPRDENHFPIFESVAAARYLIAAGIRPGRILIETCSYDTIGNAFFARVIHADPGALRRLLIVTSDFHMPRAEAVFRWVFALDPKSTGYELEFEPVNDPEMPPELLLRRQEKERRSLSNFGGIQREIKNLAECHQWLFTAHSAYRAGGGGFGLRPLDADTLRTY